MPFPIDCPVCGLREHEEFRYGGLVRQEPAQADKLSWLRYLYDQPNGAGIQTEWWYHEKGCRDWFLAMRDTRTNHISQTLLHGGRRSDEPH